MLTLSIVLASIVVGTIVKSLVDYYVLQKAGSDKRLGRIRKFLVRCLPGIMCSIVIKMIFQVVLIAIR